LFPGREIFYREGIMKCKVTGILGGEGKNDEEQRREYADLAQHNWLPLTFSRENRKPEPC
jgi:hypothetical protein